MANEKIEVIVPKALMQEPFLEKNRILAYMIITNFNLVTSSLRSSWQFEVNTLADDVEITSSYQLIFKNSKIIYNRILAYFIRHICPTHFHAEKTKRHISLTTS